MALYAQHGHGKSDKLEEALDQKIIDGVVIAARNEKPDTLPSCIESIRNHGGLVMVDPQFYVSTIAPPNDRYLPDYPYYKQGRTAASFVGSRRTRPLVESVLKFQSELQVDRILSPTVIIDQFDDRWTQIAFDLADASIEYAEKKLRGRDLLISFVINEKAFSVKSKVDDFLDQLTSWDVKGFYLIVSREEQTYTQRYDSGCLANLMYLNYVLGQINDYEVINGYTDLWGLLLRSAGCAGTSMGWSQNSRRFHKRAFTKRKAGGQPPKLRYTSNPLLNSILFSELEQIAEEGKLKDVLSGTLFDEALLRNSDDLETAGWNQAKSQLHHWSSLKLLDEACGADVKVNIKGAKRRIEKAQVLYTALENDGVAFTSESRSAHLEDWLTAIKNFGPLLG
jgi:hypothetical protein